MSHDGEVSPYLVDVAQPGDSIQLRGPIGGYFVWSPDNVLTPATLIAGGSGVVPLMSMVRARMPCQAHAVPPHLLRAYAHKTRSTPTSFTYLATTIDELDLSYAYTRTAPDGWRGHIGRIDAARLAADGWPAEVNPDVYVCGPTSFVETAANYLVDAGHEPDKVRTERFGPTGRPTMTDNFLDGNVLGGTLNSAFAVDVTGAQGRCANCGTPAPSPRAMYTPRPPARSHGVRVR